MNDPLSACLLPRQELFMVTGIPATASPGISTHFRPRRQTSRYQPYALPLNLSPDSDAASRWAAAVNSVSPFIQICLARPATAPVVFVLSRFVLNLILSLKILVVLRLIILVRLFGKHRHPARFRLTHGQPL